MPLILGLMAIQISFSYALDYRICGKSTGKVHISEAWKIED